MQFALLGVLIAVLAQSASSRGEAPEETASASVDAAPHATNPEPAGHEDPVTPLMLGIAVILLAAKVGGDLMVRIKQPAVLGELLVGVVLGNLVLFGFDGLEFVRLNDQHSAR